jgi:pyruvate kinase
VLHAPYRDEINIRQEARKYIQFEWLEKDDFTREMPMTTTLRAQTTHLSQTKIVATIGPASASEEKLAELITAGVDVFRLNSAHADRKELAVRLAAIRNAGARVGRTVGVLLDLAGPKMRLGELPGGQLLCRTGDRVRFVRTAAATTTDVPQLTTTYEPLIDELRGGDRVMLADGIVSLVVEQVTPQMAECRVVQSGTIRSRQGVNLPGVKLSVAAMNDVDRENAVWAANNEIDFVGLSFVRRPEDIHELKSLIASAVPQGLAVPQVIAKIEKPEALEQLDAIVDATDGVMVARGDLGVEIDIAQVAVAQKRIIGACNRRRRPVIIATQMLDSMQHSSLPTRAEVADVSNAILDGADACMLSGETAVGEYPCESVAMMRRIATAAETLVHHDRSPLFLGEGQGEGHAALNPITEATVAAAGSLAECLAAKLVVVASASGATALSLAKNRCRVPTLGVSDSSSTLRRMCLYWGVVPLPGAPVHDPRELLRFVTEWGQGKGVLTSGDRIVLITGTGLAVTAHNAIVVHQIP